jgi:hypothetical protein
MMPWDKDDLYFAVSIILWLLALLGLDWALVRGNVRVLTDKPSRMSRFVLVVALLGVGFSIYGWYDSHHTIRVPMAETPLGTEWAYRPLNSVFRRTFENEVVVLDGKEFVDCSFGDGVTIKYTGTEPYKIVNARFKPGVKMSFNTDNLALSAILTTLKAFGGLNPNVSISIQPPPLGQ